MKKALIFWIFLFLLPLYAFSQKQLVKTSEQDGLPVFELKATEQSLTKGAQVVGYLEVKGSLVKLYSKKEKCFYITINKKGDLSRRSCLCP